MDETRLDRELTVLEDHFTVRYDPEEHVVDLKKVEFPSQWTPTVGTVRYKLPPRYPAAPPTVHLPAEVQAEGRHATTRLRTSPSDGWQLWDFRFREWDPTRHSLVTVTRWLLASLRDAPGRSDNP